MVTELSPEESDMFSVTGNRACDQACDEGIEPSERSEIEGRVRQAAIKRATLAGRGEGRAPSQFISVAKEISPEYEKFHAPETVVVVIVVMAVHIRTMMLLMEPGSTESPRARWTAFG